MIRGRNNLATSKQGLPAGQVLSKKGKNAKSQSHLKNTRISKLVLIAITLLLLVAVSPFFLHNIGHDHQDDDSSKTPSSKEVSMSTTSHQGIELASNEQHDASIVANHDGRVSSKYAGTSGGAWTAETHVKTYGYNADWGLMEVLESSCRDIENGRIPDDKKKWTQYHNDDLLNPLNKMWVPPEKQSVNCRVLEVGCGVGVYVDALKKESVKRNRKVFGIEPNIMGGTFERGMAGPQQLAIDILSAPDVAQFAEKIRNENLNGQFFDLIYSIEVFEHMPHDRHDDAVRFLAAMAHKGTKLIFGAGSRGQNGIGHIGLRSKKEWVQIMASHGFIKDDNESGKAAQMMQEYNHRANTYVYYYVGN
jgi:hypothetical protein